MVGNDLILELRGIFHSGQVEPSSWTQRLFGSVETGLILKDISLEIKPGEVFAVLGSKGKFPYVHFRGGTLAQEIRIFHQP